MKIYANENTVYKHIPCWLLSQKSALQSLLRFFVSTGCNWSRLRSLHEGYDDDIRLYVDKGNLVGAMFIDLTKALDTVNHSQLLNNLPQYGVHGKELDWFKDYLFQRMVRVAYNGNLSQESYSFIGVPQGSILGLLLFVIAFNDITDVIKESSIIMFVDDVVLYVAADDIKAINLKLSNDMESIADWMDKNEFIINLKEGKTETLLFGTTKRLTKLNEPLCL